MLGLPATDVRYNWHEIGLKMTTGIAMMTKLQFSESTLGTITAAAAATVYGQIIIL